MNVRDLRRGDIDRDCSESQVSLLAMFPAGSSDRILKWYTASGRRFESVTL
jgi:hypothetical protein